MNTSRRGWLLSAVGAVVALLFKQSSAEAQSRIAEIDVSQAEIDEAKIIIRNFQKSLMVAGGRWGEAGIQIAAQMASQSIDEIAEVVVRRRRAKPLSN